MKRLVIAAAVSLATTMSLYAQVPVQVVVPTGVQQNPAGGFALNGRLWFGDRLNGIVSYKPNGDGTYSVDLTPGFTIPGAGAGNSFTFSYVGQLAQVSPQLALVAIPDTAKGTDGKPLAGIWTMTFEPQFTDPVSPVGQLTHLVPNKGLSAATSVAFGPDLLPYAGFLNSPNLVRIGGTNVDSVGVALNGQPILSMTFNNSDIYAGTGDGFYKFTNAPACFNNQNNCGRPTLVAGGATVAVANDNAGHVYFTQSTGVLRRLKLVDGTISTVASGFAIGSITAGLVFDPAGNLLIGELSQIDRILAADLATLP